MSGDGHGRANEPASLSPAAMTRARSAGLEELRRKPRAVSWRRDAIGTALAVLGTTALVLGLGTWLSIVEPRRLAQRAGAVCLLIALQGLGVYAAIAPGKNLFRRVVALLAVTAGVAIVASRGAGVSPETPAIACSSSHLAVDLIPLGLVLFALRRFAWTLDRSLLAGAAAAATGAIAGELSCARGWIHALIHHVGAGLLIVIACALISRLRKPETFAP
jgi:hypothetical protein